MTQKLVNGELIDLTPQEITARQNEESAYRTSQVQAYLPAYRYQRENAGITVGGVTIPTDIATRTNLLGAKALNTSITWKTPNGFVLLTAEQIAAISTAVGQHVQKCFDAEAVVLSNLHLYTNQAQVEAAFDTAYSA